MQDLKAQPRPWRLLFAWHAVGQAYNFPETAAMLQERVEENVVAFLVRLYGGAQPFTLVAHSAPTWLVLLEPSCQGASCVQANYLRLAAVMAVLSM